MRVITTNIGSQRDVNYRGKVIKTGIYKFPVKEGIFLEGHDVKNDTVVDRRYHGGIDKACYLYSYDAYPYWKSLHSNLDWDYGMFGENLTIEGLDESKIKIGATYKIGEAVIEISEPRQPCFKLGIRMGTQAVLKQMINTIFSGAYVRVLENGLVKKGDELLLIAENKNNPTIADAFGALYNKEVKRSMINKLLGCQELAKSCKEDIQKRFQ